MTSWNFWLLLALIAALEIHRYRIGSLLTDALTVLSELACELNERVRALEEK